MSIFSKNIRQHDSIYLKEDQYSEPKEYFKEAGIYIFKEIEATKKDSTISFLDIGCAAGDFLKYLEGLIDDQISIQYYGSDVMPELLMEAKKRFSKGTFKLCDLSNDKKSIDKSFCKRFDFISMFGVHTIFDNLNWIDNIVNSLNKNGVAIVYSFFNPYPYDVVMRVKHSKNNDFEPGWNVHSKQSVQDKCLELGISCEFYDFQPNLNIPRREEDGLRSWTMSVDHTCEEIKIIENQNLENNKKRIFTNATRIIHDFSFCLIKK